MKPFVRVGLWSVVAVDSILYLEPVEEQSKNLFGYLHLKDSTVIELSDEYFLDVMQFLVGDNK